MRAIIIRDGHILVMRRNKFGDKYYTLPGGGIDVGETAEEALKRELLEETGFTVTDSKLVFVEAASPQYGTQHIFLCQAEGDEPHIAADAEEAKDSLAGNVYVPMWVTTHDFRGLQFRSGVLHEALVHAQTRGFPQTPVELLNNYDKLHAGMAGKG